MLGRLDGKPSGDFGKERPCSGDLDRGDALLSRDPALRMSTEDTLGTLSTEKAQKGTDQYTFLKARGTPAYIPNESKASTVRGVMGVVEDEGTAKPFRPVGARAEDGLGEEKG